MELKDKVVIVKISVGQWTASKTDKTITEQIATNAGAKSEMCRFVKNLIPKKALEGIKANTNKIRKYYKENSLPWLDGGARVIPSSKLIEFSNVIDDLKQKRENLVKDFIDGFDEQVDIARQELGVLFDSTNYPDKSELLDAFDVSFAIEPLPNGEDFRTHDISNETKKELQKQLEERFKIGQETAIKDLWKRLHDVIMKMNEKLKDKEGIFRDSLFNNLKQVVDIIPGLNFTNDKELDSMVQSIKNTLCVYEPDDVRKDKQLRKVTVDETEKLLEKMSEYMGSEKPLNFELEVREEEKDELEDEIRLAA